MLPNTIRSRNPGAESDMPTLASAMLPDLRKYLRFIIHAFSSLCNLCVLCVSVVIGMCDTTTTETQRTQRLHRENSLPLKLRCPQNQSHDLRNRIRLVQLLQ